MEQMNKLPFEDDRGVPSVRPEEPLPEVFPVEKRELAFGLGVLVCALIGMNSIVHWWYSLEFAVFCLMSVGLGVWYLHRCGRKLTGYTGALLGLCGIIALGFARSDDGFVKFVMVCFLLVGGNLALCLMAGQNRRDVSGFATLLDAPRALFTMGVGRMGPAFRGLRGAFRSGGAAGKNTGAVLLGIGIAVPVLAVMIPLLISADAAFDGFMGLLPQFDLGEAVFTVLLGLCAACVMYAQGVALEHSIKDAPPVKKRRTLQPLTVNVVLGAVCILFVLYLVSQFAYFTGGFAGILPEDYTVAAYARRGFFEMAWLCGIDLTVIALAVGLVKKEGHVPLVTRLLCLFIGVMTLFFVITASAKMGLYIGAYGMTRLRLLTEVIMVFLGIATVVVCLWLFVPGIPYMKVILLTALIMGALVFWVDVDSVVADYNVSSYLSGKLETVDVSYLQKLSDGAVPHIARLVESTDQAVSARALNALTGRTPGYTDLRGWNWASDRAWRAVRELTE